MRKISSVLLCVVLLVVCSIPVSAEEKLKLTARSAIVMEAESGRIIYEDNSSDEAIQYAYENIFKTKTGKSICKAMYSIK